MKSSYKIIRFQTYGAYSKPGKELQPLEVLQNSHYDKSNRHHEILQYHFYHLKIVRTMPNRLGKNIVVRNIAKVRTETIVPTLDINAASLLSCLLSGVTTSVSSVLFLSSHCQFQYHPHSSNNSFTMTIHNHSGTQNHISG